MYTLSAQLASVNLKKVQLGINDCEQEVLAAMAGQPQLDEAAAAVLGSGDISDRDVHQAVKHMSASTPLALMGSPWVFTNVTDIFLLHS